MGTHNKELGIYIADRVDVIFAQLVDQWNIEFSLSISVAEMTGTDDGKGLYIIAQELANRDLDTSIVALNFKDYLEFIKARLETPATTDDAILNSLFLAGFTPTLKILNLIGDAGKSFIAIVEEGDLNFTLDADRDKVAKVISDNLAQGIHSVGTLIGNVSLTNGQVKVVGFEKTIDKNLFINVEVKFLSTTKFPVLGDGEIQNLVLTNFNNLYRTGGVVSPNTYLEIERDVPYAEQIIIEASDLIAGPFSSDPIIDVYTDRRTLDLVNIIVVTTPL